MKNPLITFIGAGKMASALIGGLIKAGYHPAHIWASCPTQPSLDALQTRFGIHTTQENTIAAAKADIIVLAVKPYLVNTVLTELQAIITARKILVISVAAGITEPMMRAVLGNDIPIVRTMPNTPALIGHGMTALYTPRTTSAEAKQQAEAIFGAVGTTLWVDNEAQINAITALSGSGPAYFFLLMEALEKVGIALGLPAAMAHQLTLQTAKGSAYMAIESGEALDTLHKQLAVKGGGTERAVWVLQSGQFEQLVEAAVTAAKVRYDEMSNR